MYLWSDRRWGRSQRKPGLGWGSKMASLTQQADDVSLVGTVHGVGVGNHSWLLHSTWSSHNVVAESQGAEPQAQAF